MTVTLALLILAALTGWLLWEDRDWNRRHPQRPELPSRLDRLDGINPPAGPSPHTHSPHGQRLSGSAGAYPDELAP